ncbi:MAG: DUF4295 domain-containing protein [Balneola sp.]|nr:MAG: DUF4295 domain-containing protein [Balneola sp.]
MAKKQVFGSEALQARASQRRMAKVIISTKNDSGKYSYREAMVDQDQVKDFIQKNKA